jgi:hypothetical protein
MGALLVIAPAQAEDAAVAVVEAVENAPNAGVQFLDYVYKDQSIRLGQGSLELSYFDSCLKEFVRGGTVTIGEGSSQVSGGTVRTEKVPCQGQQMFVTEETSEAGATVTRIAEQDSGEWAEWTVKSMTPTFKWRSAGSDVVGIYDMDSEPPRLVWSGNGENGTLNYPSDAPPLEIGFPYEVRVNLSDGATIKALFSVDPELDIPDTALSRLVPVRR